MKLTFAFCTYNRADRLVNLVAAMRAQECPIPFEILAVNNNSKDNTLAILESLAAEPGVSLRYVTETAQGIVPARNRAIEESLGSDILVFIDDDELPRPGLLNAVCDAVINEGADCVGGPIKVDFRQTGRPDWLDDEVAGFLGGLDHGSTSFWIQEDRTPIWSGNIAYEMSLFRSDPTLRFDVRYNRAGANVGGGEDVVMFRRILALHARIRYRSDMMIDHAVEPWRLKQSYFLRLHYLAGVRKGIFELPDYAKSVLGIPPFLIAQALRHSIKALAMTILQRTGALRQCMNATHAWGLIVGYRKRGSER